MATSWSMSRWAARICLCIAPIGCGQVQETSDGGGTSADARPPDAMPQVEVDAGAVDAGAVDGEFLLAFQIEQPVSGLSRHILTIEADGETASFTFQPIYAPECNAEMSGLAVGSPVSATAVAIAGDGSFQLAFEGVTFPAGNVGISLVCETDSSVTVTIEGAVQREGAPCGDFTGTVVTSAGTFDLVGTFGSVPIAPGTVGDFALPPAAISCPE